MNQEFDVKDLKGFIRRRKKIFAAIFLSVFLISVAVAFMLPPIYRSESMILVEDQQIPQDYVKSTLTSYVEERIQMITRQVMSRNRLLEIIDQFNLYPNIRGTYETESIIEKLRDDIQLETISSDIVNKKTGRTNTATIAFTLSYEGREPETVQKVAEELSSLYIKEDLRTRNKMVSMTTDFLEKEAENLKKQIHLYEQKISEFKMAHLGELPDDYGLSLQSLARLENDLDRVNTELRSLQERKIFFTGELEKVEPLIPVLTDQGKVSMNPKERLKIQRLDLISLQSTLSEKHPDIIRLKREIAELEHQVGNTDDSVEKVRMYNELKGQLAVLTGTLGSKHPDVITLSKQVENLSAELSSSGTVSAVEKISGEKPDNPAYISLRAQIGSTDATINSLVTQRNKIRSELEEGRRKLGNSPIVEKQYKELTRGYDSAMTRYNDIVSKVLEAKLAQGMESGQHGERFTIIEPAPLPGKPYRPNRLAIILLGFMLAVGSGITVAAVQENIDHSVKNAEEFFRLTNIPVFSVVTMVQTEYDRRSRRIRKLLWVLLATSLVGLFILLMNYYNIPADNLCKTVLERVKS